MRAQPSKQAASLRPALARSEAKRPNSGGDAQGAIKCSHALPRNDGDALAFRHAACLEQPSRDAAGCGRGFLTQTCPGRSSRSPTPSHARHATGMPKLSGRPSWLGVPGPVVRPSVPTPRLSPRGQSRVRLLTVVTLPGRGLGRPRIAAPHRTCRTARQQHLRL